MSWRDRDSSNSAAKFSIPEAAGEEATVDINLDGLANFAAECGKYWVRVFQHPPGLCIQTGTKHNTNQTDMQRTFRFRPPIRINPFLLPIPGKHQNHNNNGSHI